MIIEAPPYFMVDGVTVMRDHADPLQFYYLPLSPTFRTEGGEPAFSLLKFFFAAGEGGFADFDVHLGMTAERLARVGGEVRRLAGLGDQPRLAPLPVIDGGVSLMIFGQQSGGPGGGFVRAIRHAAKPALFGDNTAAFSVELDGRGVELLDQAMGLTLAPIGVVYSLDYLALRPAYHVRLSIDWNRTQEILDESFGHEGQFDSIQIQDVMERLEEERAIRFEVDTTVPEDAESGTFAARRDAAVARARDMITDAFFESSLDPLRTPPDGWDRAREVIRSFAPQRTTPLGVFTYKRTHFTRVDNKRLDVDLSERITVKRTIYPQGHLSGLFGAAGGFDRDKHVKVINADHPWFQRRLVKVVSHADFARDPVRSMTAFLSYRGEVKSVHLDKDNPSGEVKWTSHVVAGQLVEPVDLRYTVELTPDPSGERPLELRSDSVPITGETAPIQPRALFSQETIPVLTLGTFPWERYPLVQVELSYDDPDNKIRQHDIVQLTKEKPAATWERFLVGAPKTPAVARITYRAADNRDRVTPPTPVLRPQVDVGDPFPDRLRVTLIPAFDWAMVERAFVNLTYEDPAHGIRITDSIELVQGQTPRPFVAERVDPAVNLVSYRVTLLLRSSAVVKGPRSTTLGTEIFVSTRGQRSVTVQAPADFTGLKRVEVSARSGDPVAGLSFEDAFTFSAPGASGVFEFEFADPARDGYELRVRRVFGNGLSSVRDWRPFDADAVIV
ncbi:hypothetical protein OIE66_08895 [Nonomuraea sp. NBC_01738]|uniref:hypothetical protein n=1 Tax=Nonomuraea sp. NBC_01738 TaxID=2976003 RepID=UPI002E140A5C|nr:hypothetical protein OIE66_08895 [Nonomuraea sp. NBC_01738]